MASNNLKRGNKRDEPEDEEDPDDYISTAVMFGRNEDLISEWLSANKDQPGRVTDLILTPAAMYGQLHVLEQALPYGKGYTRVDACMHVARRVLLVQYCKTLHFLLINKSFADVSGRYLVSWKERKAI